LQLDPLRFAVLHRPEADAHAASGPWSWIRVPYLVVADANG